MTNKKIRSDYLGHRQRIKEKYAAEFNALGEALAKKMGAVV